MDDFISREEHNEFAKRMEADHERFNARLKELEKKTEQNTQLLISVERLATNMENMQKEQQAQGKRLEAQGEEIEELKGRDGEMWRKVTGYIVTAVIGAVIGFMCKQIGM